MPIGPKLTGIDGALPTDEMHVWHTSLDLGEETVRGLLPLLAPEEQARAARFLVTDAHTQFVLSHAFLRLTLGQYLGIEPKQVGFCTTKNGKPEVAGNSQLQFNLSHTAGTAAIAIVHRRRVGIDVERVRANLNPLELAQRFFSAQECEWLRAQPDAERLRAFFACWTAKESYIKACGEGLSMGLDGFAIIPKGSNARLQLEIYGQPEESRKWLTWELDLKADVCAAVTAESGELTIRIGEWRVSDMT